MMFLKKNLLTILLFIFTVLGLLEPILLIVPIVLAGIVTIKKKSYLLPIYTVSVGIAVKYLIVWVYSSCNTVNLYIHSTPSPYIAKLYFDPILILFDFIFTTLLIVAPGFIIYYLKNTVLHKLKKANNLRGGE